MSTLALTVPVPSYLHEELIAEMADLGFDAFEREEEAVVAYGPPWAWTGVAREMIEGWLRAHSLAEAVVERDVPQQNWNTEWEATIEPLVVGPFVVAPTWAEIPEPHAGKEVLHIDPKMSFGTGYHESTRLALRFLPGITKPGAEVLDAGTGTGILAIAALRLGAAHAVGFDMDPWSVENATENAALNEVADRFEVIEGGIEAAPEGPFELIFANIQLNTLQTLVPQLTTRLAEGGRLVLAGLLSNQRVLMLAAARAVGLTLYDEATEGEWWACVCEKA